MKTFIRISVLFPVLVMAGCSSTGAATEPAHRAELKQEPDQSRLAEEIAWLNTIEPVNPDIARVRTNEQGNVISVSLRETSFDDRGMAKLKNMRHLELLAISECPITDAGLHNLLGHRNLTAIYFENTAITASGITHLAQNTNMQRAYLSGTQLTDDAIRTFKNWPDLSFLNIANTSITEAGIVNILKRSKLETLVIDDSQLDQSVLQKLRHLHPSTNIHSYPRNNR